MKLEERIEIKEEISKLQKNLDRELDFRNNTIEALMNCLESIDESRNTIKFLNEQITNLKEKLNENN